MWPGQHAPTPAHYFVRLLADRGILRRCYSQNIDSLERTAGVPAERIVAAHGNFDGAHAWVERAPGQVERGAKVPIDELKQAVIDGAEALLQLNTKYGGLVKVRACTAGATAPQRTRPTVLIAHKCAFRLPTSARFVRSHHISFLRRSPSPLYPIQSGAPCAALGCPLRLLALPPGLVLLTQASPPRPPPGHLPPPPPPPPTHAPWPPRRRVSSRPPRAALRPSVPALPAGHHFLRRAAPLALCRTGPRRLRVL
mmetsp:Transcript_566/g.1677  ORF Transcript_566/g.1677 Transcript_566/m.1677 type:complete len:254 (-) Transcript_566:835-1596(-)